ncbi:GNAT family N-acetyltransferase [Hyphomicrobium sp. 802]|uniref:GNAT family N-acetyltransferase n=1 Tax=Hyphomicrobium sp. 802 TaxID=1112272 RepID=UPI00045EBA85|nr:GNAT family N-acetyltransferase [Hyphomicrobium sp. 802]
MTINVYEGRRTALLPLFRLADESDSQIESYYRLGTILAAFDGTSIVGMAHFVEETDYIELVSLAVRAEFQRQGFGTRLIEAVVYHCRANKIGRLIVGTGAWETDNINFYLRRGFRIINVNRGFFSPEKGYADGRRDQVQLEMSI